MARAIWERDYKEAVFVEVVPAQTDNVEYSQDDILFGDAPAPVRRRLDDVPELTRYLEAPILPRSANVLDWWKVRSRRDSRLFSL